MFWQTRIISRTFRLLVLLALATTANAAFAWDWYVDAHVLVVETSYMPGALDFTIDQSPSSSCPTGNWIHWNITGADEPSRIANVQATLSILMSASLSGKRVRVFGNNVDCGVDYVWMEQ